MVTSYTAVFYLRVLLHDTKKFFTLFVAVVALSLTTNALGFDNTRCVGFSANRLESSWKFDDPDGDDAISLQARPGWLQMQINGNDEDTWVKTRGDAPFLCQNLTIRNATQSFETLVDLATSNGGYPVTNSVAGLVIRNLRTEAETAPFELTLGLQHNWGAGTEVIMQIPGQNLKWVSPGTNACFLRLEHDSAQETWCGYYKVNASDSWIPVGSIEDKALPSGPATREVQVGLFGKTWDPRVGTAARVDFDYFAQDLPSDSPPPAGLSTTPDVATRTPMVAAPAQPPTDHGNVASGQAVEDPISESLADLRTFTVSGKERTVLNGYCEAELFRHSGAGCLTHMWFGGDWPGYERTRIRIYVDGERTPSINMELGMGHGYGFGDEHAPWGSSAMGKTGHPSGLYNTYKIPFGRGIRVTAQRYKESPDGSAFWWIVRGTENLPVSVAGVRLPSSARLRLHTVDDYLAQPFEEFTLCDVKGDGAIYQVAIAADGQRDTGDWKDISYLESIMRAYIGKSKQPLLLSSGLEDYFLGTYYFNRGLYANRLAGLTHLNAKESTFSAYRLHDEDPIFFQDGLRLTCRCGEEIGGQKLHDPPATRFTTYTWLYQW
jgi:hypothetical protein